MSSIEQPCRREGPMRRFMNPVREDMQVAGVIEDGEDRVRRIRVMTQKGVAEGR